MMIFISGCLMVLLECAPTLCGSLELMHPALPTLHLFSLLLLFVFLLLLIAGVLTEVRVAAAHHSRLPHLLMAPSPALIGSPSLLPYRAEVLLAKRALLLQVQVKLLPCSE